MGALFWTRAACLGTCAACVALWDVRSRRVPNALAAAGLVAGLGLSLAGGWPSLAGSLAGAAAFGGPLVLAWLAGMVGAGDAKAALAFGALLGMPAAVAGLLWGAVAGGVLGVGMSGAVLARSRADVRAARRQGGWAGAVAVIASHAAWGVSVPYAATLAVGSLCAFVLAGFRP